MEVAAGAVLAAAESRIGNRELCADAVVATTEAVLAAAKSGINSRELKQ